MRALIQRVSSAAVSVNGVQISRIGKGLLILLGVKTGDTTAEADFLADKCVGLRIFEDAEEKMNLSLSDVGGEVLVVSQFTLYGDARRGRRPSFTLAAPPAQSEPLYEYFVERLRAAGLRVATGQFGAMMAVSLVNDGPVTLLLEKIALLTLERNLSMTNCAKLARECACPAAVRGPDTEREHRPRNHRAALRRLQPRAESAIWNAAAYRSKSSSTPLSSCWNCFSQDIPVIAASPPPDSFRYWRHPQSRPRLPVCQTPKPGFPLPPEHCDMDCFGRRRISVDAAEAAGNPRCPAG